MKIISQGADPVSCKAEMRVFLLYVDNFWKPKPTQRNLQHTIDLYMLADCRHTTWQFSVIDNVTSVSAVPQTRYQCNKIRIIPMEQWTTEDVSVSVSQFFQPDNYIDINKKKKHQKKKSPYKHAFQINFL